MLTYVTSGGTFIVHLYTAVPSTEDEPTRVQQHLLWDRKAEGGFPGKLIEPFLLSPLAPTYLPKISLPQWPNT